MVSSHSYRFLPRSLSILSSSNLSSDLENVLTFIFASMPCFARFSLSLPDAPPVSSTPHIENVVSFPLLPRYFSHGCCFLPFTMDVHCLTNHNGFFFFLQSPTASPSHSSCSWTNYRWSSFSCNTFLAPSCSFPHLCSAGPSPSACSPLRSISI